MEMDKYTKHQATEYANNEAEIYGFEVGGAKWKDAFKNYINFAHSTMSVGRNPRNLKNPSVATAVKHYPEMFGEKGIVGKLAEGYEGPEGKVPISSIQNRVLASVTNLVKLYENGVLGTKNTTKGRREGKISNEEMSRLQLPDRPKGMSDEEYNDLPQTKEVLHNWIVRDLLTNLMIESITPVFMLTKRDIEDILNRLKWKNVTVSNYSHPQESTDFEGKKSMVSYRDEFLNVLHSYMRKTLGMMNFRKLLLGE